MIRLCSERVETFEERGEPTRDFSGDSKSMEKKRRNSGIVAVSRSSLVDRTELGWLDLAVGHGSDGFETSEVLALQSLEKIGLVERRGEGSSDQRVRATFKWRVTAEGRKVHEDLLRLVMTMLIEASLNERERL